MKQIYFSLRIFIVLFNIAVAALVLTSIWPFAMGQFQIDLPDDDDVEWFYEDGIVTMVAPIRITNGGLYAVRDVNVTVTVTNSSDFVIVNSTEYWGTIKAGSDISRSITLSIDVNQLIESEAYWMIFNPDYLDVEIFLKCKYTLKLVKFRATYQITMPWDGLIRDMGFGSPQIVNASGNYSLRVPFYVWTNELLSGRGSFSATAYNDTSVTSISSSSANINLGENYSGVLEFQVAPEVAFDLLFRNQTLTTEIVITFRDMSVETVRTVDWIAGQEMLIE